MKAIVLSVGDELVLGQTLETNSAWLSQRIAAVGCEAIGHITVGDNQAEIERAIRESAGRCEILIISGGLGPTADDLTREALAGVMGRPLELNEAWVRTLEEFFRRRGRPMPERNKVQAMVPRGALMIENTCGTAPGLSARLGSCHVVIMPGVPKEMKTMFERDVLPWLRGGSGGAAILSRTLHTFGPGESVVAEMLGGLMDRSRNPSVGTTVSGGIVSLRINARFSTGVQAAEELAKTEAACRTAMGDVIFGVDDETLAEVVGGQLRAAGQTVATAESCTGGLLAKMLTDTAGSSDYFRYGWITYANEAKSKLLGVDPGCIEREGAVSEAVVREMAAGALHRAGSDHTLAISGIAGPGGGSDQKSVGTVCIAAASRTMPSVSGVATEPHARTFNFGGDREMIRDRAAKMALAMLRYRLLGRPMPF